MTKEEFDALKEETWRLHRENERKIAEVSKLQDRTDRKIDRLCGKVKGIDDNLGYHAEEFFQDVFTENMVFNGIQYDEIMLNIAHRKGEEEVEFDICLKNGNSLALIEVKNRVRPNFVDKMAKERVNKFRKYFPEFKDYDIYLGIAGFSFGKAVLEKAKQHGIGIIKQVGNGIEIKDGELKKY